METQQVNNIGVMWHDPSSAYLYLGVSFVITLICDFIYYCLRKKSWHMLYEDINPPLIMTPFIMVSEAMKIIRHTAELFDEHCSDFNGKQLNNKK